LAARPGVELHVISVSPRLAGTQQLVHDGIRLHAIQNGIRPFHRGFPTYCPIDVLIGFRQETALIRRELAAVRPDIIHAHGTESAYALAAARSGRPAILSMQGIITEYYKTDPCLRFWAVRYWEQRAVRALRHVTCRTRIDTGFIRRVNPGARIFQIPEAMGPAFFRQPPWTLDAGNKTILFVGILSPRKGLHTLLRAMREVVRIESSARLQVIGGTPADIRPYAESVRQWGLEAHVEFQGTRKSDEVAAAHRSARLFVIPSTNENSPNTLAEAMVSGMPVIASDAGGIPSMVDDRQTGRLFPVGDEQALARVIVELLGDGEQCVALGSTAARVARSRHHPAHVADLTLRAYHDVLEGSPR
jgi:glycosyltransferase involved in cell wall biosynthesis